MDSGLDDCRIFIINNIINNKLFTSKPSKHPKSLLQEYCLKKFKTLPKYSILNKIGNEHNPIFEVSVYIDNYDLVSATGSSLKNAEEAAAIKLLDILKI